MLGKYGTLKREIDLIIEGHGASRNKRIKEIWPTDNKSLYTDRLLVSKIIGNMVINALEATRDGGSVHLTAKAEDGAVVWEVWNEGVIPEEVQQRIFQRHFSTKSDIGR